MKSSDPPNRGAILKGMKYRALNGEHSTTDSKTIRPAADSSRGSEKAARTAKARASRARAEIAAFKARG